MQFCDFCDVDFVLISPLLFLLFVGLKSASLVLKLNSLQESRIKWSQRGGLRTKSDQRRLPS
jgi:hypothetical protein